MTRDKIRSAISAAAAEVGLSDKHYGYDGATLRVLWKHGAEMKSYVLRSGVSRRRMDEAISAIRVAAKMIREPSP